MNRIRMRRAVSAAAAAVLLSTPRAEPSLDLGPEFQVNTFTTGIQFSPAAAVHEDGSFVVVWQSGSIYGENNPDGSASGVFLQRFDASGAPLGVEQQANSFAQFGQTSPDVAAQGDGAFVVVWETGCFYASYGQVCAPDGSAMNVAAQRFDADGAPIGGELIVNSFTPGSDLYPSVATGPTGEFVVAWTNGRDGTVVPDRDPFGVFARLFAADGTPMADEFSANATGLGAQYLAGVATDAAGNFVVVWDEYQPYGTYESRVVAQRFDQAGNALGGELTVTDPGAEVAGGAVAVAADGRFVVAWDQYVPGPSAYDDVRARRYAADGTPIGDELQVNTYTTGIQRRPAVAGDAAGNFVVVWRTYTDLDGDDTGVFGQGFASDGVPLGSEFQVNVYTTGDQGFPAVAANAHGEFVVAWTSQGGYGSSLPPAQDGSDAGIFARQLRLRACSASPECEDDNPCTIDTCEDEVCLNRRQPGCCTNAVECSDGNGCTDDACIDNACPHTASPECIPCTIGPDCVPPNACTTAACACVPSGCYERTCVFEPIPDCCLVATDCEDGNACTQHSCNDSHRCVTTTLADCVSCAEDADCSTGCLVGPEVCDDGRCVSPEGCPTVEIDDDPLGAGSALLIRVIVPESAPGQGKVKVVAIATIGETGSAQSKRCTAGTRIGRARMTLEPDGDSNLVLELNKRGRRCLAGTDGGLAFDVEVEVKRKKLPLATVTEGRTWRQ